MLSLRLLSASRICRLQTTTITATTTRFNTGKTKKKKKGAGEGGREKTLDLVIRSLDARKTREEPVDDEERQRRHTIGRNYGIGRFEQHNEVQHDLACKLVMKQHAIKMMPRGSTMKEQALRVDYKIGHAEADPPMDRPIPREERPLPVDPKARKQRAKY
jgi:hypothetical protein